jgi:hypothetical protein
VAYDFVSCVPLNASQWVGCAVLALMGLPMGWVHQLYDVFREKRPVSPPRVHAERGVEMA